MSMTPTTTRSFDALRWQRAAQVITCVFVLGLVISQPLDPAKAQPFSTAAQVVPDGLDKDERIDRELGALDDPVLFLLLTEPPEPWKGPRGPQPFKQQPFALHETPSGQQPPGCPDCPP